jgi:hypothetical protein
VFAAVLAAAVALTLPTGWQSIDVPNPPGSTVEVVRFGLGPTVDGFETKINVIRQRYSDEAMLIGDWAARSTSYLKSQEGVRILASHFDPLCNMDGWLVESTGKYNGRDLDLVQTAVLDSGWEYVATYTRPLGTEPDRDALRALETLCPL